MNRFWSILFLLVPILGVGVYVLSALGIAPFSATWLPESISDQARRMDWLFCVVHLLLATVFLFTGIILGSALWKFGSRESHKATYVTHNNRLEFVWTVIPAAILIGLAAYQFEDWKRPLTTRPMIEIDGKSVPQPPLAVVTAQQFSWRISYAGADGKIGTVDDVQTENLIVVPFGRPVVLRLRSDDVIHGLFIPSLRLKQDIVPGLKQHTWFTADREFSEEFMCTELCGLGHYKMIGEFRVLPDKEFESWLQQQSTAQHAVSVSDIRESGQ